MVDGDLEVDDVNIVPRRVDVLCHLGVPAFSLVTEMHACFQQGFHCCDCHISPPFLFLPPPTSSLRLPCGTTAAPPGCAVHLRLYYIKIFFASLWNEIPPPFSKFCAGCERELEQEGCGHASKRSFSALLLGRDLPICILSAPFRPCNIIRRSLALRCKRFGADLLSTRTPPPLFGEKNAPQRGAPVLCGVSSLPFRRRELPFPS